MANWSASEWCLLILTLTVPLIIIMITMVRLISGQAMAPESAAIMMDVLKVIVGGIIGILGTLISNKKVE